MRPVEKAECLSCQRPVLLSYVPTRDPRLRDTWTCPYADCQTRQSSGPKGYLVIAVAGVRH